jgi:peptidoglycan/LPS O-acetylase OafA/YrhL
MTSSQQSRFAHIDALRAVAALLVVWTHTSESFLPATASQVWPNDLARAFDFGRIGVVVFFLVSGFVIPSSLERGGPRLALAREFIVRRFFRLYPLYWLSIPLGVLTAHIIFGEGFGWAAFLANFTMIQEFLGFESAEGLYWTLQTELVFYAICLVLFLLFGLRSTGVVAAAASALCVAYFLGIVSGVPGSLARIFSDGTMHYLFLHLSLMFCGALLRRWHDGRLGAAGKAVTVGLVGLWAIEPLGGLTFLPFGLTQNLPHLPLAYTVAVVVFLVGGFVVRIRITAIVAV